MNKPAQVSSRAALTGERIAMLLWRRKLSLAALGRHAAIDRSSLSLKMHGHRRWYFDEIQDIARILQTTVAFLNGETDDDALARPADTRRGELENAEGSASEAPDSHTVAGAGFEPATSRL